MTREEKSQIIDTLSQSLNGSAVIYLADISNLNAADTSKLRRACFNANIELSVVKNTLLKKAMEKSEKNFEELYDTLKGNTSLMVTNGAGNAPARLIKDFRKSSDKPILKGAWVEEAIFVGDQSLEALTTLKSKNELLGEIIGLLQSPAKNVVSALKSGGGKLAGIVKTLSERPE